MSKKIFRLVLAVFIICFSETHAQDLQNIQNSDLSSINIDALTDEQIQQFLDRAQSSGLTLEQLELVAQQRGMSSLQISKLRIRIRQLQTGITSDQKELLQQPSDRLRETYDDEEDQYEFFNMLDAKQETSEELQIFGMEVFKSAEIDFEPSLNVATPENYVLGPGDEIIIDVYGASETTYQEVISPDGNIIIQGIGPISLSGITVEEARIRIFNQLGKIYSGVKGRYPNTFLQVTVGDVRTIKVNVVGNVVQPGTYTLSSFATAFNALYFAGGPTESGSLRDIRIIREGNQIAQLDVYAYLYEGDNSQNPSLRDQDVIVVKPYSNRVKFAGNVKQPAIYELSPEETFSDLILLSGGFKENAYKELITIDRIAKSRRLVKSIGPEEFESTTMNDGDSIFISNVINEYINRVSVEGAVKKQGFYELREGMTISELIDNANGLREDAYLGRGNLIRLNQDLTLKNISFDVNTILSGEQDILLQPNDILRISSIFDLNENQTVSLVGEVHTEGTFPFVDGMTVEDLINVSGGLRDRANTSAVEIARRLTDNSDLTKAAEIFTFPISSDLSVGDEASGFLLEPFDLVIIKSTSFSDVQKIVKIEGEVLFPGYYALETNDDNISDLVARAGGLTEYGYARGATLIRRTEYFRTDYEKEELEALVEKRRKQLEEQYADVRFEVGESKVDVIRQELNEYEKELTENIRKGDGSDILESSLFRAQQLRKLQQRDSISGSSELIEQKGVGIQLDKILKNPKSAHDLILRDGDLISVPRQLQTVSIQGEVLYPNTVKFETGNSFKKYVSSAGGFSDDAKPGKAYIVYANGTAQRTKKFLWIKNYPRVEPGADIIVPKKVAGRKLSVQELIGIATSLATMALIIDRLR